jgi:PAS domain-containing protein
MIRAISHEGDWRAALFDGSSTLLEPVQATGAALLFDGEVRTVGEVPATPALREIARWLDTQPRTGVFATASLGFDAPQFELLTPIASGLLATPLSTAPGEYVIWLRPERVRTVTWGGNPFKPSRAGDDPSMLSPRRSFSRWHQLLEGTSDPWSDPDIAAARLVGDTVSDVIVQFRSVRLLLAEDQLNQVRRQVEHSALAVVVADNTGRILKMNAAFGAYLPEPLTRPERVDDLLPLFSAPEEMRRRLADLTENRKPWRGEVEIAGPGNDLTPMLVRADPVFASLDRTLGFVLLFTDLTERKAAEAARRSFQKGVIEQRPTMSSRLDSKTDLQFRNLLSTIVENAQLAALEIADRVDPARMPQMLEGLRASVARTAEVLRYLLWHAARRPKQRRPEDSDVTEDN